VAGAKRAPPPEDWNDVSIGQPTDHVAVSRAALPGSGRVTVDSLRMSLAYVPILDEDGTCLASDIIS
jgi:hypothetical protein